MKITPLPSTSPRKTPICHLQDLGLLKGSERQKPKEEKERKEEGTEGEKKKAKGVGNERER